MALVQGPETLQGNVATLQDTLVNMAVALRSHRLACGGTAVLLHLAVSRLARGAGQRREGEQQMIKRQQNDKQRPRITV